MGPTIYKHGFSDLCLSGSALYLGNNFKLSYNAAERTLLVRGRFIMGF